MADYYPYLIASLPMLHFGMKPPFSYEQFLEISHQFISEKDFQLLKNLPNPEKYPAEAKRPRIIQNWIQFDTALRNEVVKIRAKKKHVEPAKYLHPDEYSGPSLAPVVATITMSSSVLDVEKALDEARWRVLDELATAHYFDLELLITYAYKLLILQRWENIRSAAGPKLLEAALHQ